MKTVALILALAVAESDLAGASTKAPPVGPAFRVHGRLSVYCGNPACRIWIIGTKRILGVAESEPPETAFMPPRLSALLTPENLIFGDFTVEPLTKEEEGVMRIVCVTSAENLVITDNRLQFVRQVSERIEEEPNKAAEPSRTTVTPPVGAGYRASGAPGHLERSA